MYKFSRGIAIVYVNVSLILPSDFSCLGIHKYSVLHGQYNQPEHSFYIFSWKVAPRPEAAVQLPPNFVHLFLHIAILFYRTFSLFVNPKSVLIGFLWVWPNPVSHCLPLFVNPILFFIGFNYLWSQSCFSLASNVCNPNPVSYWRLLFVNPTCFSLASSVCEPSPVSHWIPYVNPILFLIGFICLWIQFCFA